MVVIGPLEVRRRFLQLLDQVWLVDDLVTHGLARWLHEGVDAAPTHVPLHMPGDAELVKVLRVPHPEHRVQMPLAVPARPVRGQS
eukprot:14720789-Alexandrium_andersonii.AAC.1